MLRTFIKRALPVFILSIVSVAALSLACHLPARAAPSREAGTPSSGIARSRESSDSPRPAISACGTRPAVVGNDNAFTVTVGTGKTSACTIAFATPWTNTPVCVITLVGDIGVMTAWISAASTTAITVTTSASVASQKISGICHAYWE